MNLQSSWMLVRFIFSEPPRELPIICHFILCISWPWLSNSFGKMFYLLAYISGVLDIEDGICFYLWINLVWKNMAGIQAEVSIQPSIHPSSMCPSSTSHPSTHPSIINHLSPIHPFTIIHPSIYHLLPITHSPIYYHLSSQPSIHPPVHKFIYSANTH